MDAGASPLSAGLLRMHATTTATQLEANNTSLTKAQNINTQKHF